jgi:cell division protein ZapB
MESELKSLEEKIDQFVQLCKHLRAENIELRQALASATSENRQLNQKISAAANRLEALLPHIPEGKDEVG